MDTTISLSTETRRLLGLAWPVMLTSLNWTILHVTDVIVVGLVSTEQVAALGASRTLTYIVVVAVLSAMSGVLVFTSRADGAGDSAGAGRVLRAGLVLAGVIGVTAAGILVIFAPIMLDGLGVAAQLVPDASQVVRVMALSYPFQLVTIAASYFLEGLSQPRRVMAVNLAILPLNAVAAWALAAGKFGLPELGAVGAAAATACASAVGAVAMLAAVWTLPEAARCGVRDWSRTAWSGVGARAWQLASFGVIPALASGLELAGFAILIALSTELGDVAAHAFQIVFSIHNVTYAVALGLGSAAGVRSGNAVGEGKPRRAIPRVLIAVSLTGVATASLALLIVVARRPLVALFPAVPDVHQLALFLVPLWAPFICFDGIQAVLVYALRSLGDQIAAGINSIVAYFLVTGGAGIWLVHHGAGAFGLVYASGLGMIIAALLHGARFAWVSRGLKPT